MTTLVWRRGLRGPSMAVNRDDKLDETDRRLKITTHLLKPGEENLTHAELVKLYPAPKILES